ncbi:hypothetical protein HK098_006490 [Nowakowskiella sp. JEL0407]|nr:hypothetical protein HK098_006490 [Nowakowskiella sp. JEL0407]
MEDDKAYQDPDANLFEGLKKKKKKKKNVNFEESAPAPQESTPAPEPEVKPEPEQEVPTIEAKDEPTPEPVVDDDDTAAMFENLKKKKKSKKKEAFTEEESAPVEEEAPAMSEFDTLPKKKSKSKKSMADFEKSLQEVSDEPSVDFGGENGEIPLEVSVPTEAWLDSDRDYTYEELLGRIFTKMPSESRGNVIRIVPPQVVREGTRKTVFANVVDVAKSMHRTPEHVIQFLHTELSTHGSIDGAQRLVIKGVFKSKQIETVLKRYIAQYVACKTCKSPNTILTKENRLFFVQCESCGSSSSVAAIKQGFQAQTSKRSKQKAA